MNYWLVKTEPETFSWDDLMKKGKDKWDGVRNYAARGHLKNMKVNDLLLFYHSGENREVVAIAKVVKEHYPDQTSTDIVKGENPWVVVDVAPVKKLKNPVTLNEIKMNKKLKDMILLRIGRLSVQPVKKEEYDEIVKMGS